MAVLFRISAKLLLAFWLILKHNISCDLVVTEPGYASYTRKESVDDFYKFKIEFKTMQPTGLLLHAKGSKDFITLELIRGKLRYAADYGNSYDSYDEWTSGYHELFLKGNLANGEWHTIILRHTSERVYLTVTSTGGSKNASRTIPQKSSDFSVEYVHVGGMKGIGMLSKQISLSQRGIKGCFRNAYMNSKSLITGKDVTLVNAKVEECVSYMHTPINFPAKDSYLSYNHKYQFLHIKFGLKTNSVNQSLIEYISGKGNLLSMNLNASGKIVISIGGKKVASKVAGLQDSFWHEIQLSVSDKSPFEVSLSVDGQKESMYLDKVYLENGEKILIGKGYIGCLKDVNINRAEAAADHFEKHAVNNNAMPVFGKCILLENCIPNPCLNGGKCTQMANSFACDCTTTGYKGDVCSKSLYSQSCDALKLKEKGRTLSGKKLIDVDGIGPLPKVEVECQYASSGTITKVHNKLANVTAVENHLGSKFIRIPYTADKRSLKSIIALSSSCKQYVDYSCVKSYLFQSPKGPSKVRWLGLDHYYHYYWGGSNGRTNYCACGIVNACKDTTKYCNCDAHSADKTNDEGYLTDKNHLPMQNIEFLDANSWIGSQGRFRLGPLLCSGDVSKQNAVSFRDSMAYLTLKPTSVTGYNDAINALTISFDFKTTLAIGVMVYATGISSPDLIKISILDKTKARAEINLGSNANVVDVDIDSTGRSFDDNNAHSVFLEFNRKQIEFSIDYVTTTRYIDPTNSKQLDLDGQPMFLGGGSGVSKGFTGCIRAFYLNGKLIDVAKKAKYMESYGVFAGCGIGCNRPSISPCNYGKCIENYKTFSCDCTVSSLEGKYCHKESFPLHFTSNDGLMYAFEKPAQIQQGQIIIAFKTDKDALIFSLHGENQNCHLSLVLQGGQLKLLYNFDKASSSFETMNVVTSYGKKNFYGKLYSLKIIHNGKKISLQLLDGKSKAQEKSITSGNGILTAVKISIANNAMPVPALSGMPRNFNGCISAFKYNYLQNLASKFVLLDIFRMYGEGSSLIKGKGKPGKCGKPLPTPPPLPALLNRPTTASNVSTPVPGPSKVVSGDISQLVIIAVACAFAFILIVVIILFCRHINRNLGAYKTNEDQRPLSTEAETSFMPPPDSKDVKDGPDSSGKGDDASGKKQEWYV